MSLDEAVRALEREVARGEPGAAERLVRALRQAGRGAEADAVAMSQVPPRDGQGRPVVLCPGSAVGPGSVLLAVEPSGVTPLGRLPFGGEGPAALAASPPFALGLQGGALHVHRLADQAPITGSPFALPAGFEGMSVARAGRTLLVGGRTAAPPGTSPLAPRRPGDPPSRLLLVRDLEAPASSWEDVPVPERMRHPMKAFDALVVLGPRLVAVDDFIMPHTLVEYALDPGALAPRLVREVSVPERTLADHVVAAAGGEGHLALVAQQRWGGSRINGAVSLALLDAASWREVAYTNASYRDGEPSALPFPAYCDVAIGGGHLVAAAGQSGLAVLDLAAEAAAARAFGPPDSFEPLPAPREEGLLGRLGRWLRGPPPVVHTSPARRLMRPDVQPRRAPLDLGPRERCLYVRHAEGGLFVATVVSSPDDQPALRHVVFDARPAG